MPSTKKPMPKPRTRTFSGCLTCRNRKVKCDLGKPTCHNCDRLKLSCRGYEATLHWLPQWLPTVEDDDVAYQGPSSPPSHGGRMRTIQPHVGPTLGMLEGLNDQTRDGDLASQLDKALAELDSQASNHFQAHPDWQRAQGPFGVFSALQSKVSSPVPQQLSGIEDAASHVTLDGWDSLDAFDNRLEDLDIFTEAIDLQQSSLRYEHVPDVSWQDSKVTMQSSASPLGRIDELLQDTGSSFFEPNHGRSPWQMQSVAPSLPVSISPQAFPAHKSPYLPQCAQYLLWHYSNHTIPSLSGIPHNDDNSLWKQLHLPTALRAYAELGVLGDSSLSRVSLLYSIMSIACFQLKALYNDSPKTSSVDSLSTQEPSPAAPENWKATDWEAQGVKFRDIAQTGLRKFLRNSGKSDRTPAASPVKYKEVLVAAISLVCIQIVSGDTKSTRPLILQCEQIVQGLRETRNPRSRKTSSLHEMLYYIQVFESASSVESDARCVNELMPTVSDVSIGTSEILSQADAEPAKMLTSTRLSTSEEHLAETSLDGEVGYGIPTSLIHLLARTTALVHDIETAGLAHHQLTVELEKRSVNLENAICAWQGQKRQHSMTASPDTHHALGLNLLKSTTSSNPCFHSDLTANAVPIPPPRSDASLAQVQEDDTTHSLPRLMTDCLAQSLHAAILIFFSRTVRRTHPTILQHYVESVLSHLEIHASLKTMSSPARLNAIVWPAFIAACEAIEDGLRRRAVACLRQAAWAGFCNWETAEAVTREVWRRRDAGDIGASWQQVVRDMSVHMILT